MELMQASRNWASRPADERFTSLYDMRDHFGAQRQKSRELQVASRKIIAQPCIDNAGLEIVGPNGAAYNPTHFAFSQIANLAEAPAGYLRTLPSPIAADCINYGLQYKRNIEDVGILLYKNGENVLRAATGPRYGRIWNEPILNTLCERFGDGVSGDWKVPGEFGEAVPITKANTTLFAGDRDMFIFLADEQHKIEVPNRRNGKSGLMSRGFFLWNSEVGSSTFGLATFVFDYTCSNRIVWGADNYKEIRLRHTASAPDRWLEEVQPALRLYANSSARSITDGIAKAQAARLDDLDAFLAGRFGKRMIDPLKMAHRVEEGRPIETLWDVTVAVTAHAKSITHQDERVALERKGGDVLDLAA